MFKPRGHHTNQVAERRNAVGWGQRLSPDAHIPPHSTILGMNLHTFLKTTWLGLHVRQFRVRIRSNS